MRYLWICLLLFGTGLGLWAFAGKQIVALVDRVSVALVESQAVGRVLYETGTLQVGDVRLDLLSPAAAWVAHVSSVGGRLVLESGGRRFWLVRDPGDEVSFVVERSRVAWSTPFAMNFMTGYVPSRRRNVYLRLRWSKASGAKLGMTWMTEQVYDSQNGWRPGRVESVSMGLMRVEIREAGELRGAAVEYLKRVKGWGEAEYRLEDRGPSGDGSGEVFLVFLVIHAEDERAVAPGAGRSVELVVSYGDGRVVRELGGQ